MSLPSYKFHSLISALVLVFSLACVRRADAQACCAGASAATPGRLAQHERALVGVLARGAVMLGSYRNDGHYVPPPKGVAEDDLEQDLFGALRLTSHAQVALLVPVVETRRTTLSQREFGGGIGDLNVSGRYDFVLAGESRYVPGIALLAGLTLPTGRAPESSDRPLATDSTGTGAFQGNAALALEQIFGNVLVGVSGLVAKRASRTVQGIQESLGTQFSLLALSSYTFDSGLVAALVGSYAVEGNATQSGVEAQGSGRRLFTVGLAALHPLSDHFRLQASASINPPISSVGRNLPATVALSTTVAYTW